MCSYIRNNINAAVFSQFFYCHPPSTFPSIFNWRPNIKKEFNCSDTKQEAAASTIKRKSISSEKKTHSNDLLVFFSLHILFKAPYVRKSPSLFFLFSQYHSPPPSLSNSVICPLPSFLLSLLFFPSPFPKLGTHCMDQNSPLYQAGKT